MRQGKPKRDAIRSLAHLVNIAQLTGAEIDFEVLEFMAEHSAKKRTTKKMLVKSLSSASPNQKPSSQISK